MTKLQYILGVNRSKFNSESQIYHCSKVEKNSHQTFLEQGSFTQNKREMFMKEIMLISLTPEELEGIIRKAVLDAIKSNVLPSTLPAPERFLTRKETADKLKISLVTLHSWTKSGLIPSYVIGGRVLFKESEIENSLYRVRNIRY
ncbi:helix-turn-helix domain-containing protein [Algoriphagus sanaruensis]|uniref:Helix-turn-helix domain-containing protein n=1 Tax=Algoriphagus sanaruensis TaxID=1727163 RepID=A0A142EPN5_9BACT|nr:helix-turn-helix domain-containing protein [Algoriphagus sanaruensis]AMQ57090.1 hypothetical protein AO498_11635 [Algoriphagus sanaruensis]